MDRVLLRRESKLPEQTIGNTGKIHFAALPLPSRRQVTLYSMQFQAFGFLAQTFYFFCCLPRAGS
jgi:hypothetical protein